MFDVWSKYIQKQKNMYGVMGVKTPKYDNESAKCCGCNYVDEVMVRRFLGEVSFSDFTILDYCVSLYEFLFNFLHTPPNVWTRN